MAYIIEVIDGYEKDLEKFIRKLDKSSQARLVRMVDLLEKHGNGLGMPFVKKIEREIWELRSSGKHKIRILYVVRVEKIIFLNWFIKKSQKTPKKEISKALSRVDRI